MKLILVNFDIAAFCFTYEGGIKMEFTKKGTQLETNGNPLQVGDQLPAFTILDAQNETISSNQLLNNLTFISVVPNINTPVCSLSTRKFNEQVAEFPTVDFYTISTNTPAEQKEWCALSDVTAMHMLSDEKFEFGKQMGLFIADNQIDARSVWVIDTDGKIIYRELVRELSNEPNYQAVLNFIKNQIKK